MEYVCDGSCMSMDVKTQEKWSRRRGVGTVNNARLFSRSINFPSRAACFHIVLVALLAGQVTTPPFHISQNLLRGVISEKLYILWCCMPQDSCGRSCPVSANTT
jgi:hypothetical protein